MDGPESESDLPIVWIDCEMTGLNPQRDVLLEIAVLVTWGHSLDVAHDALDLVMHQPNHLLEQMKPVCRDMHTRSGLIDRVRQSNCTVADAEREVLTYLTQRGVSSGTAPMGGNSVHVDRVFLARYMPALSAFLHYRLVDVSTVKELCRRWYPQVYAAAPRKRGRHRALDDIAESIAELAYYRNTIFRNADIGHAGVGSPQPLQ
ncbi:hypothetical protein CDCA_CDCA02G0551 [Cyanidium caldarium]|uniref:Exonuclease domain-containing protein n=1 Tax=Cyanidium caldarium TaxID=2771 RepID=A0AAV9IR25_CYACA|nr:hypothetical protein CDCA_CDCA02G0551 [Cyanidium caldarium]